MCRTTAPAEWSCADEPSTWRVIVHVLLDTLVISKISSSAVSGSITTVKVIPPVIDEGAIPPSKVDALATTIDVAPDVIALVMVVC
jgi:hypothetical protein